MHQALGWCLVSAALLLSAGSPSAIAPVHKAFRIYVYDWPESVTDAWPGAENFTHHRLDLQHVFRLNNGTGPVVSAEQGRHRTHQYSLFLTLFARLRESPFITRDPEEATVFFVPYDIGMDATTRSSDGALTATSCPRLPAALALLRGSPYFDHSGGANHIVLHSINQPMTYFLNSACQLWYETCRACIKLSIDVYKPSLFRQLANHPALTERWISIPFTSDYHFSADVLLAPWKDRVNNKRRYPMAFMGSPSVSAKKSRQLRLAIRKVCASNPAQCLLQSLTDHSSNALLPRQRTSVGMELGPYHDASFCLMPGGDFPSRKAVLDALLTGCVPVIFQAATALTQWTYHWGGIDSARNILLYIPMKAFVAEPEKHFFSLVDLANNSTFMNERRARIAAIGSFLQYNVPGHFVRLKGNSKSEPDAVDVIISNLAGGVW